MEVLLSPLTSESQVINGEIPNLVIVFIFRNLFSIFQYLAFQLLDNYRFGKIEENVKNISLLLFYNYCTTFTSTRFFIIVV